jgi:hypothetical protein
MIISRMVDSSSGLLATALCSEGAYSEYFLPGTEPQLTCAGPMPPGNAADSIARPKSGIPPWPR